MHRVWIQAKFRKPEVGADILTKEETKDEEEEKKDDEV